MLHAKSYESGLIGAARNSASVWAKYNEERLLSLEGRLRLFVSDRPEKSVDVYAPLDIMLDSGNSALLNIYQAAIDSAFRVHQNNFWRKKNTISGTLNYSPQEDVLRIIRGLVPNLIASYYPNLRGLIVSIDFFLNDTQRQIELYLKHDANVNPQHKTNLESLQIQVQGLYAKISSRKEIPFDRPTNHRRLRVVPPNTSD